jgi:hypothetical protein
LVIEAMTLRDEEQGNDQVFRPDRRLIFPATSQPMKNPPDAPWTHFFVARMVGAASAFSPRSANR